MPPEITRLVERFLHNPVRVEVSRPASSSENIKQMLVPSSNNPADKRATLRRLIKEAGEVTNAIIFCNRKRDIATLQRSLERHGFSAGALHGDMDQHARLKTLESFREGRIALLVASDVAARGLDIPAVSHVFNFDVPTHAEDYVHRIGRTGRAGRTGAALTIFTKAEGKYVDAIESLTGRQIERAAEIAVERDEQDEVRSDETHGRPKREDRKRGGRRRQAQEESSKRPTEPQRAPRESRADRPPQQPRRERRAEDADDAGNAVGFADHVPAFLLRPVRVPKTDNIEETADAA
jgi:superfamily II DNA/RNA helicase